MLQADSSREGMARMIGFIRRVADHSSDDTLSREARALAQEAMTPAND